MLLRRSNKVLRAVMQRRYAYNPFVNQPNPERSMERDVEKGNMERQILGEYDQSEVNDNAQGDDFYQIYKDL